MFDSQGVLVVVDVVVVLRVNGLQLVLCDKNNH